MRPPWRIGPTTPRGYSQESSQVPRCIAAAMRLEGPKSTSVERSGRSIAQLGRQRRRPSGRTRVFKEQIGFRRVRVRHESKVRVAQPYLIVDRIPLPGKMCPALNPFWNHLKTEIPICQKLKRISP